MRNIIVIVGCQDSHSVAGQVALNKKQGVSGQSVGGGTNLNIDKVEKDFHTRTLIKEAIQDNDFLKNLTASQVKHYNTLNFILITVIHRCKPLLMPCMRRRSRRVVMLSEKGSLAPTCMLQQRESLRWSRVARIWAGWE